MTFTSFAFIVFLPLVAVVFYFLPVRFRWVWLLLASCYFYMAFVPQYLLVLFFLICTDFVLARHMARSQEGVRRAYLTAGILSNVAVLFVFKYFNFFNANLSALAGFLHWSYGIQSLHLLLPLGLSFHTFQSISYLVEVYRGKYEPEKHLGVYALYVMFFPQLVAGPIERPQHLLPQLSLDASWNSARAISGLRLIAWGFFKKLVIADRLGISVDYIYAHAGQVSGPSAAAAMIFFAFQLYTDFSGYTDIARGCARILGIELVRNFEQPYFSRSVAEFWRRWHISLSTWFRDYFYYPLVYRAKRLSVGWLYACTIITFLVTGLWHGAGWTFAVMGLLFGALIVLELMTKKTRERIAALTGLARAPRFHAFLQTMLTFALVCVAWVFFRAPTLHTAFSLFSRLPYGWAISPQAFVENYFLHPFVLLGISGSDVAVALGCVAVVLGLEYVQQSRPIGPLLVRQPLLVRSFLYSSLCLAILLLGIYATVPFIYFQF